MWFLVQVVKGSKFFDVESQVRNQVLISDTTDLVVAGRSMGADGYRFEARKGNESFVLQDFTGAQPEGSLAARFLTLAQKMGAVMVSTDA